MPYRWKKTDDGTVVLWVWPFRSLPRRGYVWFIGVTAALLGVPLLAVLGSPVLWGLLPFMLGAGWALAWALRRSYRSGHMHEVLTLTAEAAHLTRQEPDKPPQSWHANPYWIRVKLRDDGPVEDYLTLTGGADDSHREVELGAFLSPEERVALAAELRQVLGQFRRPGG